jgi:cytochrome c oxidase cbb3-type subunit 3
MPALGTVLGQAGLNETAAYVLSLSGTKTPADWAAAGKVRFDTLCVGCHGVDGHGNPGLGIPNLTDKIWLYGGDLESVSTSIRDGRSGVMPSWRTRMSAEQIRLIATWVYAQRHREPLAKS